jgi:hypothetical protein
LVAEGKKKKEKKKKKKEKLRLVAWKTWEYQKD